MKKTLLLTILFSISSVLHAQSVYFDTNGPMGECLFPTDGKWQEIVECDKTHDEILQDIVIKMMDLCNSPEINMKINEERTTEKTYTCDVQLYIGRVAVEIPFATVHRNFSEVTFNIKIDVKDYKYRITFFNFYTDRMTISGDGECKGPSNAIHWQRVNSLTKERAKARKKEIPEYDAMIEREKIYYPIEWAGVCKIMDALKQSCEEEDF